MLNSATRSKVDRLWDSFWSGGISNPLIVIEQISYLLFIKRLDDRERLREKVANRTGQKYESIFPEEDYRWSNFKHLEAQQMFDLMLNKVFPFIKTLGNGDSVYTQYMKDAVFMIQKPSLLHEAVQTIEGIKMDDQDTKGDLYEYLLEKLQISGVNGQFRTPRHIIKMMVEILDPRIEDRICDPACGTAGFLVAAGEYILKKYTSSQTVFEDEDGKHDKIGDQLNQEQWAYYKKGMFSGRDFDTSMLRISAMNLMLHGIEEPDISYADSLSSEYGEAGKYTIVLANPPFKGNIDEKNIHSKLKSVVDTKKTELLFIALFLRILDLGGRCACIVPDGVLFGSSNAHKKIRQALIEENQLEGIISMPSGIFKPYAGVSTGILIFTKGGRTNHVWFYDMQADGFSLDDKRDPTPDKDDIPDILKRWRERDETKDTDRTDKAFLVPKQEIVENGYDLSINRYKQVVHEEVEYEPPKVILKRLKELEAEIVKELDELEKMMG
jgi:type I restriction enzyme M protein